MATYTWSYRILIIGGYGSGKTNTLLNLINEQNGIDKIYLCATNQNITFWLKNVKIQE